MDAIKKQLDVLMATNRNGDVREVDRRYYDRNVSRLFLSGLCSHETFQLILWNDGKKQAEVIGSHKAYLVVIEVREMIENEDSSL